MNHVDRDEREAGMKPITGWRSRIVAMAFGLSVLLIAGVVYAQGGLGTIEEKARDIQGLVSTVAGIIVAIGAVITGVKFVKGDPDAWGYAWKFGLGAVLVFSAGSIVTWLGN